MVKAMIKRLLPRELRDLVFAVNHYRHAHGVYPRLLRPRTLNEKILRRKVFDRRPLFTTLADKYAVRQFVADRVGSAVLPRLYCVTTDPETIAFDSLPRKFVVKPTHASGWVRVVHDEDTIDRQELIQTCKRWLGSSYYEFLHERGYKDVPRRIMIEEFIDDGSGESPTDYKFFTFRGKVHLIQIDTSRFSGHRRSLYDLEWRDTGTRVTYDRIAAPLPRPANLDLMLQTAAALGRDLDFVRVDLYDVGRQIYFGEMTATPGCGASRFEPELMDYKLGTLWL
jgi:TupA-like ATPgrasp